MEIQDVDKLKLEDAQRLLTSKIAFIADVEWSGLYLWVDGVRYFVPVSWAVDAFA
jgi:hypothetical protein